MADPLSTVGLGIGAVSLILQITDECIKRYKYFTEATQMSESYRHLRVRVQVEQQRFLSFAMEAGLLYADGKICATLQVNQLVLRDVLVEINSLFQTYEERNGRYVNIMGRNNVPWNDKGEPQTNLMELLCATPIDSSRDNELVEGKRHFSLSRGFRKVGDRTVTAARKLRIIFAEPRRLVWVSVDKEGFESLVSKLEDLNSFLIGLLDTSHARKVENTVEMSYLELLQLRDDVQSLGTLIRALDRDTKNHNKAQNPFLPTLYGSSLFDAAIMERQADETKREYLKSLATLKIRHIEIDQPGVHEETPIPSGCTSMLLDFYSFDFCGNAPDIYDQERRSIASWKNRSVWVEWIERSSDCRGEHVVEAPSEERVALLTRLLYGEMPPGFRSPRCLGYVKSPRRQKELNFGIVFERPSEPDMESTLVTLRQLLVTRPKPPITARVSLCSAVADCLFSFHAVDWLHKGLRSDNVLFLSTGMAEQSLTAPFITGYDLSRPSDVPEMTEKPPFDPQSDIYRHPHAQFGEAKNYYRKSYDMYSLGVVLIEIALWKPIETILGFENLRTVKRKDLRGIRQRLLGLGGDNGEEMNSASTPVGSEILAKVARKCGDSYRDIIEICLNANEVERPAYRGESQASIKSRLRTMFKEQVTEKLRLLKEVLSVSK
ncbi:prion-inhibition and propagation-domain-containing protein [Hypoxylon sp. FL1857]|nr:prion-inhibition and propagation-domain-containing protein [Hypoxylon sp. FL1857]